MEKQILEKLLKFGLENDYFAISEIGKLDNSCCPKLKTEVIDFDKTEEIHRAKHNYQNLKSCDALRIINKLGRIDFIEMKSFKEFIRWQFNTSEFDDNQIEEKIYNFDFIGKIRDSIIILNNITFTKGAKILGKERKIFHQIPKNFIILTDIDIQQSASEYIAVNLTFLSQTSSNIELKISEILKKEVSQLDINSFDNIQQPILLSCKDFDEFFKNN